MIFHPRFQHITENIFKKLDINVLKNCRQVSTLWRECIDNQKILWTNDIGNEAFQLAYKNVHLKFVEILIRNSARFNIDLRVVDNFKRTAFQNACENGLTKIAEILIQKSTDFNIDLNEKNLQMEQQLSS